MGSLFSLDRLVESSSWSTGVRNYKHAVPLTRFIDIDIVDL
jgi:hypothetical protein